MEFYLSIDGEKQGPVSMLKVGDWLREGRIDPETLGWHRDLDGWKPLSEIAALESVIEREIATPEELPEPEVPEEKGPPPLPDVAPVAIEVSTEVRPVTRFLARMLDGAIVIAVVNFFVDTSFLEPRDGEPFADWMARYLEMQFSPEMQSLLQTYLIALIGWHFVEGVLIHVFGTTPGKAALGIRIVSEDGSNLPVLRSIGRSVYVLAMGMGFHWGLLPIIGMTFSLFRLLTAKQCLWDQQLRTRVVISPLRPLRIVLAFFGFFLLIMLLQSIRSL
ncbi:MAG: RDD family protein [Verrucomicrobiota bacterium]